MAGVPTKIEMPSDGEEDLDASPAPPAQRIPRRWAGENENDDEEVELDYDDIPATPDSEKPFVDEDDLIEVRTDDYNLRR
eukprot:5208309-Pyramimonas_sp.AAC.2